MKESDAKKQRRARKPRAVATAAASPPEVSIGRGADGKPIILEEADVKDHVMRDIGGGVMHKFGKIADYLDDNGNHIILWRDFTLTAEERHANRIRGLQFMATAIQAQKIHDREFPGVPEWLRDQVVREWWKYLRHDPGETCP